MAKMMTAPNIAEDQFIYSAVTGVVRGQKAKNQSGVRNRSAATLMARPYFPRDHRLEGKGGPLRRLQIRHPMTI